MVDIKITTTMELELKTAFDLVYSSTSKKMYKEALEIGALDMLAEVDPIKASELKIGRYAKLIEEEQNKQANYKLIQQLTKKEVKKEVEEDLDVENNRLEKYEERKISLATQINNNSIDWKLISSPSIFNFKTPSEVELWTREHLLKDGLIGCENCRKWKPAEQYCPDKKTLTKSNTTCRNFKKR